jgi:uncharacterized protein (TIGR00251 family)
MAAACFTREDHGVVLRVRVVTRAARAQIDGIATLADGMVVARVRVRAAPREGEANAAIIEVLSTALARPKSQIQLISGATSRIKRFRIAGGTGDLARTIGSWPKI